MKIDAHHHFWKYDPVEYDWIDEEMRAIRRDFLPADLKAEISAAGIDGVISVQARQTIGETEWLLNLARDSDFIKGVVGWVPLVSPNVSEDLERFASNPRLRSVRHVLQGEPDGYMRREDFNAGIRALKPLDLAYDLLVVERQLPEAIAFVDRHPSQVFVLDHIAKPRIRDGGFEPWNTNIRDFAKRENVFCKLSGVVTEANWTDWTAGQLRPYLETALEAFGPSRAMFGSDWPVCLVASTYKSWTKIVERMAEKLSLPEQAQIFGGTARKIYRLK